MRRARNKPRVLLVDDEPNITDSLKRHLRREYAVFTAGSGKAGLEVMAEEDDIAVVVSDMRMPEMDGARFLSEVRQRYPDTVRILLTGFADLESAIAAVNHGQLFRFLTKPCPQEQFLELMAAAARQYELQTAERVLLEQTLKGSIKALSDVLALAIPDAFGRATRVKERALQIGEALGMEDLWQLEVAALLSQIGAVVLPPETADRLYSGRALGAPEQEMVARLPKVGSELLANIPRMTEVADVIAHQDTRLDRVQRPERVPLGARILKVVLDYDTLSPQGKTPSDGLEVMRARKSWYDGDVLGALAELCGGDAGRPMREVELYEIAPGMVLAEDIRGPSGMLLVARGYEVTSGLVERLRNLESSLRSKKYVVFEAAGDR